MTGAQSPLFSVETLTSRYAAGDLTPSDVVEEHLRRIDNGPSELWITTIEPSALRARAQSLEASAADGIDWERQPLYGVPFAVKDNIDHAGTPTTAACPAYEYTPESNATVVEKLLDAGAILVGKTNLDQFATGLVGTRSPYGTCPNAVDPAYISGGSSSGSAVAVALGQVAFALGTDTAGSGRVPAALNGIVGLKPSRGMLSNQGVVPACKTLDCVAIFATNCRDALTVERVAAGFDPADGYSRREADSVSLVPPNASDEAVLGVPRREQLEFFGDEKAAACFSNTIDWLARQFELRTVDIEPFIDAGRLLYQGPWVAERLSVVRELLADDPDALLPVTRDIVTRGEEYDAVDVFEAEYELRQLAHEATERLTDLTAIVTPTTGTTYTIDAVEEEPLELNSTLGYYTNFMNLLDLAAVAVPGGRSPDGLPYGVTVFAEAFDDAMLAGLGEAYCRDRDVAIGAEGVAYSDYRPDANDRRLGS
jgi:allophanate hydrolase